MLRKFFHLWYINSFVHYHGESHYYGVEGVLSRYRLKLKFMFRNGCGFKKAKIRIEFKQKLTAM